MSEKRSTPPEIQQERILHDAELIKDGAIYVEQGPGQEPRLELTKEQVDMLKRGGGNFHRAMDEFEWQLLQDALRMHGSQAKAAKALGLGSQQAVHRKITILKKRLGIS